MLEDEGCEVKPAKHGDEVCGAYLPWSNGNYNQLVRRKKMKSTFYAICLAMVFTMGVSGITFAFLNS